MRGYTDPVGLNMACIEGVDVYAVGAVPVGNGQSLSLVGPARRAAEPDGVTS